MQRKNSRHATVVQGAGRSHPPITLHDLDIYFSERGEEDRDFQHIGITYNINHGVQVRRYILLSRGVFGGHKLVGRK